MKRHPFATLVCLALAGALGASAAQHASGQAPPPRAILLLVVDGLRPDYVTTDIMPRLSALGRRGVVFTAHHSVFPTVTRVNSSSMSTGAYPDAHGLMGNTIFAPKVFADHGLNTADAEQLLSMEKSEGRLLTAPTLGEMLERAGKRMLVVSAGSSGSALLLNHPVYNGAVINPEFIDPPSLERDVMAAVGKGPAEAVPNNVRNKWAVDALLSLGLGALKSDVTALWFGDPDATAHQKGVGTEVTRQALRYVDAEIGRIEDTLQARGLLGTTDILVASDHGFSTHTGTLQLAKVVSPFSRPAPDGGPDIVVTEGAINFRGQVDPSRVAAVVRELQRRPEVGAIFTRPATPGSMTGTVPGTLSFNVAHWNHPRSSEIMISGNWTADSNDAGFPGTTTQGGTAGHGTSSPFDIHNTLVASGPDFREQVIIDVPTSNVDLAPTMLRLLGLAIPQTMEGRPLDEAFRTGPDPGSLSFTRSTERAATGNRSYEVTAHISSVAGHRYLDYTEVRRSTR